MPRVITVKACGECPYCKEDDGGGHCGAFVKCEKFNIMLQDDDGPECFDIENKIHPCCKLKKQKRGKGKI